MTSDEARTARLLFWPELASGAVDAAALDHPAVARAVRHRPVPPAPARTAQALALRLRNGAASTRALDRVLAARRAILGERAGGPPRVLIRVDEFPHARSLDDPRRYGPDRYARFHDILAAAGVPYLVAVMPAVAHRYLDPDARGGRPLDERERETLRRIAGEGTTFALHGYDHRTRHASPRRHSELTGLDTPALEALLDRAAAPLRTLGIDPRVFVPCFNRFAADQYAVLARRFDVVCGGPESVRLMGLLPGPAWRGDAVYLPSYPPLYGRAAQVRAAVESLADAGAAVWAPVALHWGWEADDDWEELERLVQAIAPYVTPWDEFLAAVDGSR